MVRLRHRIRNDTAVRLARAHVVALADDLRAGTLLRSQLAKRAELIAADLQIVLDRTMEGLYGERREHETEDPP